MKTHIKLWGEEYEVDLNVMDISARHSSSANATSYIWDGRIEGIIKEGSNKVDVIIDIQDSRTTGIEVEVDHSGNEREYKMRVLWLPSSVTQCQTVAGTMVVSYHPLQGIARNSCE
jgi:hypothetical protein